MGELWINQHNGAVLFVARGARVRVLSPGTSGLSHDELIRQWRSRGWEPQKWESTGWCQVFRGRIRDARWVTWQCERCGKWDYDVGTNRPVVVPNKRVCWYCATAEEARERERIIDKLKTFPYLRRRFVMLLMYETVMEFARLCGFEVTVSYVGGSEDSPEELPWLRATDWSFIELRTPWGSYATTWGVGVGYSRCDLPRLLRYREGSLMDGIALLGGGFRWDLYPGYSYRGHYRGSALYAVRVGQGYILKVEHAENLPRLREICEVVRVRIPGEYGERLLGELDGVPEDTQIRKLKAMITKRMPRMLKSR